MAKKKTLKSLLGGSDGRVQASLDLAKKPLRPTIQQGGQSYTAVQETQKASQSQLGMLADSLSKLNPALQSLHKGYMAETEMQKMEFAETFQGLSDEERTNLINEKETALKKTEKTINSQLRGQYELNPLAAIYAEKLVGGAASTEFSKYSLSAIENYKKEIEKLPIDKRPDAAEYRAWADNLVNEFNAQGGEDGGELFERGKSRHRGLLAATKDLREKLSLELPKTFSDHHKDTVYIPSLVSNLRAASTDATITKEARLEKITTFLSYLEPLDVADTKKVMTLLTESFKAEDADFARTALTEIAQVTKIGTEKMVGSVLMDDLLEKIDDTEDAYDREILEEETKQKNAYIVKTASLIDDAFRGEIVDGEIAEGTGGVDYAQQFVDGLINEVDADENISPALKHQLKEFLIAENEGMPDRANRKITQVEKFLSKSEGDINTFTGFDIVEELMHDEIDFGREKYPEQGISQQNNAFFSAPKDERDLLGDDMNDKTKEIIANERTIAEQTYQSLLERSIQEPLTTRKQRADWVMEKMKAEGGAIDTFKKNVSKRLRAMSNAKYSKEVERKAIIKQEGEEAKAVVKQLNEYSENMFEYKGAKTRKTLTRDLNAPQYVTKSGGFDVDAADRIRHPLNFFGLFGENSEVDGSSSLQNEDIPPSLIETYQNTANFLQGQDKIDQEKIDALPAARNMILGSAEKHLPKLEQMASRDYEHKYQGFGQHPTRRIFGIDSREEDVTQYLDTKAFVGYGVSEMITILESNDEVGGELLYNENGVPYNLDYFSNNYGKLYLPNIKEDAASDKKVAGLLNITVEELYKSQEEYRRIYNIK